MGLITQIADIRHQETQKLITELTELGVEVHQPFEDLCEEDFSSCTDLRYMAELELFESIAHSSFHLVDNAHGLIDAEAALQIIYAMSKQKPIVLTGMPEFDTDVAFGIRDLIAPRLHQVHCIDAYTMDATELLQALTSLPKTVDYQFTAHESRKVRLYGKTHFRELLGHLNNALAVAAA